MFSLKSSQVFEKVRKTTLQVPTPVITSSFVVKSQFFSRKLNPVGSFPRRVVIGETLFKENNYKILSPVNGIAYLDPTQSLVSLRIDGNLNFKPSYLRREFSILELKQKLDEMGIVSLDFPGELFSHFIELFSGSNNSVIVLSPITSENNIDFKNMIFSQLKPELEMFKKNLEKSFPNSKILDFLTEKKVIYKYPDGLYKLFLKKYCGITNIVNPDHKNIFFIGPETIYYILQALYYNIPFHERIISVNLINKKGKFEGETKYFRIKNGTNLSEFLKIMKDKFNYNYFSINSIYKSEAVFEIINNFIYDIYSYDSFYICETKSINNAEGICIECGDCNYYCPVNAKPFSLLSKDKNEFVKSACLECGLCSVFCPAKIDFHSKIKQELEKSDAIS